MLRAGAPTQLSKHFGGCAGRGASCSCPGSALPALLASCCRVTVTPRKQRVKLEGAKTQTPNPACTVASIMCKYQPPRCTMQGRGIAHSIKHPGGCFRAPQLGAGSPHPSWSQDGVPGCELGWWGAARWRLGAHLQGAGLQLAAEAAWDEEGGTHRTEPRGLIPRQQRAHNHSSTRQQAAQTAPIHP